MADNDAQSFHGPLYEQVHNALRSRILAGEWEPREPLPGEATLARELGVSIGTVRKAMDQLTRDNIVIRERGRGTFIRRNPGGRPTSPFGLCDRSGQRLSPDIGVTSLERAVATEAEREAFGIGNGHRGHQAVFRLEREWKAKDKLLCQETLVVEEVRFPRLGQHADLDGETLFELYAKSYRTRIDRVDWEIDGEVGPSRRADDVILHVKRRAFDERATAIELCDQRINLLNCRVQLNR